MGDPTPSGASLLLRSRLTRLLPEKIRLLLLLAVGICVPYFGLQWLQATFSPLPTRTLAWPVDAWIPFQPGWVWVYHSLALMVPLAPLLAVEREQLTRYGRGLALMCTTCFVAFLLFPVAGPRPHAPGEQAFYELLVAIDTPTNAFPSLHAGLVVYSLAFAWRVLRRELPRDCWIPVAAGSALWGAAILYSTVATKQHWIVDVPAGMLVAALAHGLAWRAAPRTVSRASELPRSHAGPR